MKSGNVEAVGRIQICKKKISQSSFIYNIGRFGFRKEQTFAITASAKALMGLYLSKQ